MHYKRRDFLKLTSTVASGIALAGISGQLAGCTSAARSQGNGPAFGLQLYTLRDVIAQDPAGIIRQLATFGYKQIESYEGDKGMFWGMKNTEFKTFLDDLGMEIVASHCDYQKDLKRKADEAAAIGMKYLICPYIGPQKTLDDYRRHADNFNKAGEVCKQSGLKFAYHNHHYTFEQVEGQYPQDVLMQSTDKDLVDFEMDMYWVVTGKQDPVEWFKKYPNRFRLGHVKDKKGNETTTLGTGVIDYENILKIAAAEGMRYFIVEQEEYTGTTPIAAAKDDAAYMKKIKV